MTFRLADITFRLKHITLRLRACTGGFLFVILRHENKNISYHETESIHTDFGVLRDAGGGAGGLRDCHAGGQLNLLAAGAAEI